MTILNILAGIGIAAIIIYAVSLTWLFLTWKRINKKSHLKLVRSKPFQEAANRQIDSVFTESNF
jgi:hypothetical protein